MEDREFLVERVITDLNNSLTDACNSVITNYDIPLFKGEKQQNLALTIIVKAKNSATSKPSKKNKKIKKAEVEIFYSVGLSFDISYLSNSKTPPIKLGMIFSITEPDKTQFIYNRISYWSKPLFEKVASTFREYGLSLNTFPLEMYFDEDGTIYISKLPTFDDLIFFDKHDVTKNLDKKVFIEEQVNGLLEAAAYFNKNKN